MKHIIFIAILLFSSQALAGSTLTWTASTTSGNITYNIYANGEQIATGLTELSYDIGKRDGTISVTAVKTLSSGSSAESEPASVIRPTPPTLLQLIYKYIASIFN